MENKQICRFCFNLIEGDNFELLERYHTVMLEAFLGHLNLSLNSNPIVCYNCADILQKCLDFKVVCFNSENYIKTFISLNSPIKVNLEDIRESFKEEKLWEGQRICRLCFNLDDGYFTSMYGDFVNGFVQEVLAKCIPEINLDLTNDPVMCQICWDCLQKQYAFMQDCLKLEEKIKLYCKLKLESVSDVVNLYNIWKFLAETGKIENAGTMKTLNSDPNTIIIKTELDCDVLGQGELGVLDNTQLKLEYKNEENEKSSREPTDDECQNSDTAVDPITVTSNDAEKRFHCSKCTYSTNSKSALKSHMISHKNPSEVTMFRCTICGHETKRYGDLKAHMIIHKDPNELQMHKCPNCTYESRRKADLRSHLYVHNTSPYKCEHCEFVTKNFKTLTSHTVVHEGRKTFRCTECSYTSRDKSIFTKHCLVHKNIPNKKAFQCNWCQFVTHTKRHLKDHLVMHAAIPENELFRCYWCDYKCKRKSNLKSHMLLHYNPSQEELECDHCCYKTFNRRYFQNHLKCHKDLSEVQTFKCEICRFQTRYKRSWENHMIRHSDATELYKCEMCCYTTKVSRNLSRHKRNHKPVSGVQNLTL